MSDNAAIITCYLIFVMLVGWVVWLSRKDDK